MENESLELLMIRLMIELGIVCDLTAWYACGDELI